MSINSPNTWRRFQIEVAHEWRDKHHLPKLSDAHAQWLYWGWDAVPAPVVRPRMNTKEHIQRLLKVWDTWKQK